MQGKKVAEDKLHELPGSVANRIDSTPAHSLYAAGTPGMTLMSWGVAVAGE